MKKILFAFAVGCIPATAFISGATAQNSKNVTSINNSKTFESSLVAADKAATAAADLSSIHVRAIKDFSHSYKDASETRWSKISDGYVAWFKVNGIVNRTFYDKSGNWHFTVSYYDEKNLNREVRAIVKRTYYDYSIVSVQEVRVEDKTIYLVNVQDDQNFKVLRICDGEMETVQDFKR
jgi:hypothetical protein